MTLGLGRACLIRQPSMQPRIHSISPWTGRPGSCYLSGTEPGRVLGVRQASQLNTTTCAYYAYTQSFNTISTPTMDRTDTTPAIMRTYRDLITRIPAKRSLAMCVDDSGPPSQVCAVCRTAAPNRANTKRDLVETDYQFVDTYPEFPLLKSSGKSCGYVRVLISGRRLLRAC